MKWNVAPSNQIDNMGSLMDWCNIIAWRRWLYVLQLTISFKQICKWIRFHVSKTSFLSICKPLLLNISKNITTKIWFGLKIKPTLGRVFRTLKREGAFWPFSEKLLEKLFNSPKSLETWYNTSLFFNKHYSSDQNNEVSVIFDNVIIQQQFFCLSTFFFA